MNKYNARVHLKNGDLIDITDLDSSRTDFTNHGFVSFREYDGVLTLINSDEILFFTVEAEEITPEDDGVCQ